MALGAGIIRFFWLVNTGGRFGAEKHTYAGIFGIEKACRTIPLRIVIERRLLLKPLLFEGTNHFFYFTTF